MATGTTQTAATQNRHDVDMTTSTPLGGETYFSIDIEADGPIPGPYSMSSIGVAVAGRRNAEGAFEDLRDQDLGLYLQLKPISSDYIPEAAAVAGLDRAELIRDGLGPKDAMRRLVDWISEQAGNDRPVMAAYPLSYDWMWVYWYLMRYAGTSPFGHSSAIDIKTLFATKADRMIRKVGKRSMPKKLLSKRPHTHHALDDAWEQADLLVNLLHWDPSI